MRTSLRSVSKTGKPAPSWTFDADVSKLANRCYIACLSPYAKSDLIKVYWNSPTSAFGRCFISQRIITIARGHSGWLHTLAHEIAHLKVLSHCPKHVALTEDLYQWLQGDRPID